MNKNRMNNPIFRDDKPVSMDVVAPRTEQPKPKHEWPGQTSMKFKPAKAHIPCPVPPVTSDISLHEPAGRSHFKPRMDVQRDWKPS